MAHCKYCFRSIPDNSVFCPYCGRRNPIGTGIVDDILGITDVIKKKVEENIPEAKKQFSSFLSTLSSKTESAKLPNFIKKDKIVSVLNDLREKIGTETDSEKVEEYTSWANLIEKSISGESCIVCLQPFNVKPSERLDVRLCPSCHYAAHTDHFVTWLKNKPVCPICKAEITENDLISGYLELKDEELVFTATK